MKKDCYWYRYNEFKCQHRCGILDPMVCTNSNKCTFYETEEDFNARQEKFDKLLSTESKSNNESDEAEQACDLCRDYNLSDSCEDCQLYDEADECQTTDLE